MHLTQSILQEISNIQEEVYIIAGVFGGITIILLLMVLGLSCTIARYGTSSRIHIKIIFTGLTRR